MYVLYAGHRVHVNKDFPDMAAEFGIIRDDAIYHLSTITSIFRWKDDRTTRKHLDDWGVKYVDIRGGALVAGSEFKRAIEYQSRAEEDDD